MSSKDINLLLTAFLDGELAKTEQACLKAHVANCRSCAEEMKTLASVQRDLKTALMLEANKYSPSPRVLEYVLQYAKSTAIIKGAERNIFGFPKRLTWKTGLVGAFIIILVIGLVITMPLYFRHDNLVRAIDIAMNSEQVQTALGGAQPLEVNTLDAVSDKGKVRVLIEVGPNTLILADVDMGNQEVVSVQVQEISDITKQEVMDIARTDSRVQELFNKGAKIHDLEMVQVYPALLKAWRDKNSQLLGLNPDDLIGFIGSLSLEMGNPYSPDIYYVVVNVTTGKVVAVNAPNQFIGSIETLKTTIISDGNTTIIP